MSDFFEKDKVLWIKAVRRDAKQVRGIGITEQEITNNIYIFEPKASYT